MDLCWLIGLWADVEGTGVGNPRPTVYMRRGRDLLEAYGIDADTVDDEMMVVVRAADVTVEEAVWVIALSLIHI